MSLQLNYLLHRIKSIYSILVIFYEIYVNRFNFYYADFIDNVSAITITQYMIVDNLKKYHLTNICYGFRIDSIVSGNRSPAYILYIAEENGSKFWFTI